MNSNSRSNIAAECTNRLFFVRIVIVKWSIFVIAMNILQCPTPYPVGSLGGSIDVGGGGWGTGSGGYGGGGGGGKGNEQKMTLIRV